MIDWEDSADRGTVTASITKVGNFTVVVHRCGPPEPSCIWFFTALNVLGPIPLLAEDLPTAKLQALGVFQVYLDFALLQLNGD